MGSARREGWVRRAPNCEAAPLPGAVGWRLFGKTSAGRARAASAAATSDARTRTPKDARSAPTQTCPSIVILGCGCTMASGFFLLSRPALMGTSTAAHTSISVAHFAGSWPTPPQECQPGLDFLLRGLAAPCAGCPDRRQPRPLADTRRRLWSDPKSSKRGSPHQCRARQHGRKACFLSRFTSAAGVSIPAFAKHAGWPHLDGCKRYTSLQRVA